MKRPVFKRVFLVFIAVLYGALLPIQTNAVDNPFYSSNDIHFFDETATKCAAGQLALAGKDNRQKIYNFLVGKGLNSQQAAGVLGNIQSESGYSPTRHEQSHSDFNKGGYGIAQWTFGRRDSLKAHLDRTVPELVATYYNDAYGGGVRPIDGYVPKNWISGELMPLEDNDAFLSAQLNFLFDETSKRPISARTASVSSAQRGENEWEALKKAVSVEDATKIWLYNFEIPANIEQAAITRSSAAQTILSELSAESSSGGTTTATGACLDTKSGDVTALQATVKLYAWPEYHRPSYVTLKPEYSDAVGKAVAAGKYVGGIKFRGVDCGGFVTRVMIDSGFEPTYNASNGATAVQKKWLDANWENLGSGSSIDTASLQPGDVAMKPGHTFMFAGTNIEGFGTSSGWKGVASASLDERAPMAGLEDLTDSSVTWYRKKVVNHE